jgi:hypothetical protein
MELETKAVYILSARYSGDQIEVLYLHMEQAKF